MGRYTGPVGRISRRLGEGISPKGDRILKRRPYPPGQHGHTDKRQKAPSAYGLQLMEKQKARYTYGLMEKQFRNVFQEAERKTGVTGDVLLSLLERRLDNVVYRLGLAKSRAAARQLVSHRHITVNGSILNIPSARVKVGDVISVRAESRKCGFYKELMQNGQLLQHRPPDWIRFEPSHVSATILANPEREHAEPNINAQTIVEFYSR